jgi:UDP-glucose 4-epimerase
MANTILITGAAGFISRYVGRHFSELGCSVIGIDSSEPENAPLASLADYYTLRLPNPLLNEILQKHQPDVCIHCAGRAAPSLSMSEPTPDFYANTVVTYEILNALRLTVPGCRFIYLSSAAVYGNPMFLPISETHVPAPISPYGFHKLQAEMLCQEFTQVYGLPTASVRIFSAYGPGLRRQVLWDICQKAIMQKTLTLDGIGQESRDFIHALDIAKAFRVIADDAPMRGEVYNLAGGQEVTISDLATMILSALESKCTPQFNGVVPSGTPLNWQADISKLQALGFTPSIPMARGVKTFANWCLAELVGV